jgi:membrane protease subunit (stomatin/prohibitin family)
MEQLLGGALGAAVGGSRGGGVAGAIIGVAIGTILQQLTAAEQNKRQAALQAAAKKGKSNWTTTGKDGKKATYQKVGAAEDMGGKKCSKVKETITLPDGKQGTSTETVCFG